MIGRDERREQFELDVEGYAKRRSYKPWYERAFEVSKIAPRGVLCLFSALEVFGIAKNPTTSVWLAIPNKARVPRSLPSDVKILRFSDESLEAGKRQTNISTLGEVTVHTPAKAIVDCFKFRLKLQKDLGISMAELLNLLKDMTGLHKRYGGKVQAEAIQLYLDVCRMRHVMGPYLHALEDPRLSPKK